MLLEGTESRGEDVADGRQVGEREARSVRIRDALQGAHFAIEQVAACVLHQEVDNGAQVSPVERGAWERTAGEDVVLSQRCVEGAAATTSGSSSAPTRAA